jgi:hypothetical protein
MARAGPPVILVPRVLRPPRLDDFLSENAREAEARITDFRQYEPGDGVPASRDSTAYLSYDEKNLYVIFVCKDEPDKVRAHMARREDIETDDKVVVNLDTFDDHRHAYSFFANPLGIQKDSFWTEGQGGDDSWDTLWQSEGRLTPVGYVVWMAIPFKSLRFPRIPVQHWGIALGRAIRRNNEMSYWPFISQRTESFAQQFAALEALRQVSPGHNIQLIPYGVFTRARFLDVAIPGFRSRTDARAGLDAKIVIHDALTLDFALNPDFSQVESDEPQVTVNQRFEVFFPEKRPFFIENASYFKTPVNLFFSRRIADPQFGARLTGKVGPWAIGALAMDDRGPESLAESSEAKKGLRSGIGAGRVQRDFRNQSTVGLLFTSRDMGSSSNRVFSLDARVKLNSNWVFSGQLIRSDTHQLDGTNLAGPSYWAELSHTGRHLVYASRYLDHSPDFRADLGFIPRVDIRKAEQYARYYWKPERGRVAAVGPDITFSIDWDHRGLLQDWLVDASFGADFKGPTGLGCRHVNAYELFQGIGFRKHKTDCGVNTAWLKWLEIKAEYGWGSAINLFPGPGLRPFPAGETSAMFGFTWRPSPRFRIDQTYLYERLGTGKDSVPVRTPAGAAIFNDHILRAKLNYQFTRELSLRAIVDYNAVLPNSDLIALERTKRLTGDLLVTYLVNPGTALFVGYADIHENLALEPAVPATLVRTTSPGRLAGRQFFVKFSYLRRF